MANDDEKTKVEANEAEGDSGDKASAKKSGGSKKLILFGGIGVGAVVIGIALALFVLKPMMSNSSDGEAGQNTEIAASGQKKADTQGEKKKRKKEKKEKKKKKGDEEGGEAGYIGTIKDIVINPAGTGGSRFLSVSFGFELESPEAEAAFEAREPAIRDALITILSSKTVAQLTDPKQKEILRYQIKRRVSKLMETDELAGVYYTDFVLQ